MKLNEWFNELSIDDNLDEIHSVYRAIYDDGGKWGYDVKKFSNGRYAITDSEGNRASYSKSEKECFIEYLDEKYGCGQGVEGQWMMSNALHKED